MSLGGVSAQTAPERPRSSAEPITVGWDVSRRGMDMGLSENVGYIPNEIAI